ncbi:unnamed protein product [Candida verbasci]|uniref:Endonuclease/exonuclease/phosphatase domain-containing protein n=1 Tax=Candida verbasci TaxID=1227364 RepID=A0A9W4U0B8_9ASCO|nr:unnamed protein product [Candida verbasci]
MKNHEKPFDPSKLTPEYIEEQRRIRNERKEKERKRKEELGLIPPPEPESFIKRPFIKLNLPSVTDKLAITIMSYNILAQTLIRRELYSTNGKILKWHIRSKVLLDEITHYNPSILTLQECDKIQYNSFWKQHLTKLGYECKYYQFNTKNHGLVIAYKSNLFNCKHQSFIKLDQDFEELPVSRIYTKNVAFITYLEFTNEIRQSYPYLKNGLMIGTTHLFWHPFGTFERTRQMYMILHKFKDFQHTLSTLYKAFSCYSFLTGDFNSEPFDAPYLSITSKPITYENQMKNVLGCSLTYKYSKERSMEDEDEEDEAFENERKNNPDDPEPSNFHASPEQDQIMQKLQDAHNSLNLRAISLYSVGYKFIDSKNSTNHKNEPVFSNWVDKWNGI